jgi:ubiquitin-conjugating enzyme E2 D/E
MPVFLMSGATHCTLFVDSIETRVSELKVMIEQKTGTPQCEQDLVLEDGVVLSDMCRLCHYADALYRNRSVYLIRRHVSTVAPDPTALRRLRKEFRSSDFAELFVLQPMRGDVEVSPLEWTATISGPASGPYAGGTFRLDIMVPPDYPYKPPRVLFATPVFHPLVSSTGSVDLHVLHEGWSPALTLMRIVALIRQELEDPYDRPYGAGMCLGCGNNEAAMLSHDRSAFDVRAREVTLANTAGASQVPVR